MYIQANIGRDVQGKPMGDLTWETFRTATVTAIIGAAFDGGIPLRRGDFQVHTGVGEWEGVAEESSHVSVYYGGKRVSKRTLDRIRDGLGERLPFLAGQYGQDAIAFIVTESHLATA